MPYTVRRIALIACGGALLGSLAARPVDAQSLRGSRASVDRMYRQARAEALTFAKTPTGVRRQVDADRLVQLTPSATVKLHAVGFPYVRPAARTFVRRLGAQYHAACGEPLVVTSAVRPATRQPANSHERSVHPTGMAVDLRRPRSAKCLDWLRRNLLRLEKEGVVEATEERSPAHFHVAVFPTPYKRYVAARAKPGAKSGTPARRTARPAGRANAD